MNIKFTEYPDDKARRGNLEGVERLGQIWGPGPTQGTQWVVPVDPDSRYVLVHRQAQMKGFPSYYALKTEA